VEESARKMRGRLHIVLRFGTIETQRASALITSANDSLVGNLQPDYWRFSGLSNADGALRRRAGPELAASCLAIKPLPDRSVRRDLVRWTGAVKRDESAPVRCPTGHAVATPAFALEADHVVHAVAPDIEPIFGRYRGPQHESDDRSRHPEELLRDAYTSAFAVASSLGASSVACPALGCGVKGWKAPVSAAFGLDAAARLSSGDHSVSKVAFVLADRVAWDGWVRVACALLGRPAGVGDERALSDAERGGELRWSISTQELERAQRGGEKAGDLLELGAVPELHEPRMLWATPEAGLEQFGNWRWQPHSTQPGGGGRTV
jgi:O-acetyl-ADP-ribose deacetylase (regulator of RNase III)